MTCKCHQPPFHFSDFERMELGEDAFGAEVSLATCKQCGVAWLRYLIEEPHYSRSGRWWRVMLQPEMRNAISAANAKAFIEQQAHVFAGGSFFNSAGHSVDGPIRIA